MSHPSIFLHKVVVLLIAGSFFLTGCQQTSGEKLFVNFFVPVENIYKPTPKRKEPTTLEEKAFAEYDRKDFPEAAKWFALLEQKTPEVRFYEANALLASNQTALAIPILEPLLQEDHAYRQVSEWLLALAYLRANRTADCAALLEVIANTPGHPNQSNAIGLWEQIQ